MNTRTPLLSRRVRVVLAVPLLLAAALAAAITFGGPGQPPPMSSISAPFRDVDLSTLPALQRYQARDGTPLAYRAYAPAGKPRGSVVLVHGSSASSHSLHSLAGAIAAAGYAAYALDLRGHGESGVRGHIAHIGQLDDDLEDFMRRVQPARPATLAGFSSGGGFALRIAAGPQQTMFEHYLLLSPFISQDAPTYRPNSGGWVSVGVPRIIGLSVLDRLGVHAFDRLPVVRFALNDGARALLTPQYSFALAQNFRPLPAWRGSIRSAGQPMQLLAGRDDEAFHAERFAEVFAAEGRNVPVTLLDGVGHVGLTLEPAALQAVIAALGRFEAPQTETRSVP